MQITNTHESLPARPPMALNSVAQWAERRSAVLLALMTTLFVAALFGGLTAKLAGWAQGYDQIDYQQSIWNTTQGRFLEISHYRHTDSLWGLDFIPAILLIVPFYALLPSALTLNFFQALCMGLGALPTYAAARERFGSRLAGLGWAAIYLLYPSTWFATMSAPWQPRTLAVPALIGAFFFLQRELLARNRRTTELQNQRAGNNRTQNNEQPALPPSTPNHQPSPVVDRRSYEPPATSHQPPSIAGRTWLGFALCLLVALTTRTDASLCVIGFGLLAATWRMGWRWALPPIVVGAAWLLVSTSLIVPAFYRSDYVPQEIRGGADACADYSKNWPGKSPQLAYYCHLGSSTSEIALTVLTRPDRVAPIVFTPPKLTYLLLMLLPLLLLPLLAPDAALPALPILAMNVLTNRPFQYTVREQYQTLVIPGLIIAAIVGGARLWEWYSRNRGTTEPQNHGTTEPSAEGLERSSIVHHPSSDAPPAGAGPSSIVHRPSSDVPPAASHQPSVAEHRAPFSLQRSSFILLGLVLCVGIANLAYRNPVITTLRYREDPARIAAMERLAALVPPDAPLATTSFLAPNMMPRRSIYYFPNSPSFPPLERAEYLFIDTRAAALETEAGRAMLAQVRNSGRWRKLAEQEDLIVYQQVP
jgi:hypothetical protein